MLCKSLRGTKQPTRLGKRRGGAGRRAARAVRAVRAAGGGGETGGSGAVGWWRRGGAHAALAHLLVLLHRLLHGGLHELELLEQLHDLLRVKVRGRVRVGVGVGVRG
jgi:hypothetical protein